MEPEPTISALALKLHTDLATLREYKGSRDVCLAVIKEARRKFDKIAAHLNEAEREANMLPPTLTIT